MGQDITVTYKATVLADAVPRETNTATVTFTNWPDNEDGTAHPPGTTPPDKVAVYSFPLTITKKDLNDDALLRGACFTVTTTDGKVYGEGNTACTDAQGALTFTGLAGNATYTVTETETPEGYTTGNLARTSFTVRIDAIYDENALDADAVTYTFTGDTTFVSASGGDNSNVTVYNAKQQSDMPFTGGNILTFVGIAGALAVGAAGLTVVGLKKRGREQSAA